MGNLIRAILVAPLVALVAALGVGIFGNATPAFAWSLSAQCQGSTQVTGVLDIPNDSAGTYTVFVEYRTGPYNWAWVQGAGAEVSGSGQKSFTMNVSETPADAVSLRVRYKNAQGVYGPEISGEFPPCGARLYVFDLQAECTNVDLRIYGGMIGVPKDATGFPWTVFMEYQDPGNAIPYVEDWHWVSGTGVRIGPEHRGRNVNFEFTNPPIPSGVTELRVRYKSGEAAPWVYGPEISRTFPPCAPAPTKTPTNTPVPPTSTPKPNTPTNTAVVPTNTPVLGVPTNTPAVVVPTNTPAPSYKSSVRPPNTGTGGYKDNDGHGKGYYIGWVIAGSLLGGATLAMLGYTLVFIQRRD